MELLWEQAKVPNLSPKHCAWGTKAFYTLSSLSSVRCAAGKVVERPAAARTWTGAGVLPHTSYLFTMDGAPRNTAQCDLQIDHEGVN
jgi:hypothetical protein